MECHTCGARFYSSVARQLVAEAEPCLDCGGRLDLSSAEGDQAAEDPVVARSGAFAETSAGVVRTAAAVTRLGVATRVPGRSWWAGPNPFA